MIDEKKIEEAADKYAINTYAFDEPVPTGYKEGIQEVFQTSINWFKENLWHPMSDKPEMGAEILIQRNMEVWRKHHPGLNVNSTTVHEFDFHDDWKSYEHDDEFTRWLYIEDLMKGGL